MTKQFSLALATKMYSCLNKYHKVEYLSTNL